MRIADSPDPASVYRRVSRRETHSPRSLLAIVLAVVLILVFAWVGTEIVLALVGAPALLVSPASMFGAVLDPSAAPAGALAAGGIVAALIGIVFIVAAVAPGRRARHLLAAGRAATVVDNEVIASALARHASLAADVDPDNARVSVSHRRAVVHLTPTSGVPVDHAGVTDVVTRQLESYGLRPRVTTRVLIPHDGKVGA
jgi:hypothetical protein